MFLVKHFGTICSKIINMNKFSSRLKELRTDAGLSRAKLAEILNVSTRLIAYWEAGERQCDFDTLIKISDIFNVSADYLLGRTDY